MCGSVCSSRWLIAVLVATLTSGAAPAQHHERKRVERVEIEQLQQQWRDAQLADDVTAMDHLLADDFLGVTAAGQVVTKAQQLDRMRSRQLNIAELDISDTKIKFSHTLAVVTSLGHLGGSAEGRPLQGYFRLFQVFQRTPGDGWKMTNFEATRVRNAQGVNTSSTIGPVASPAAPPAAGASSPQASPVKSVSPQPPS